jgi:membrane protein implicated in regulation of membrane protease activity
VKTFLLYTLARGLVFAATWALVWLVASTWLEWSTATALWTALVALLVSSVVSFVLLRPLRERMAQGVHGRAVRIQERYDAAKRKEDVDGD